MFAFFARLTPHVASLMRATLAGVAQVVPPPTSGTALFVMRYISRRLPAPQMMDRNESRLRNPCLARMRCHLRSNLLVSRPRARDRSNQVEDETSGQLKWKQTAEITENGQGAEWTKRSVRFVRGKEEAVLWHKDATVTLVRLYVPLDFDDFIELEEFITKHPREPDLDDATSERKYLQEMELFLLGTATVMT
jgi:hypothetical protein